MGISVIPNGSITSTPGFQAGGTFAGLKRPGPGKLDMALLASTAPCTTAGVFTQNKIVAAPITVSREHLEKASPRAVVINSGTANTYVGQQGIIDAREMAELTAKKLGLKTEEVLVCSTGVTGAELPMGLIRRGIAALTLSDAGHDFARGIMTTDTRPKEIAVTAQIGGKTVTVSGAAKGVGMLHPNMATLLAFVTTNAAIERACLQRVIQSAAEVSFNMVTVDGDTSPNDTFFLFANGLAGNPIISGGKDEAAFQEAVNHVCIALAKMLAADGEGATKLVEVQVEGARSATDARLAARTIASSNLMKAAIYGNDPNWGRALAALSRSGAEIDERKVVLHINDICLMDGRQGQPIPFFREAAVDAMSRPEVRIVINLGLGNAEATAWGCDLTTEYVRINSAYTT